MASSTKKICVFACRFCSLLGAERAGCDRLPLPAGLRLMPVSCAGSVSADAVIQALVNGADGVAVIGTKFVIYRFSEKLQAERNQTGRAKRKPVSVAKSNPVRKGAKTRREAAKQQREQRNEYFRQQAIDKAIEREREKKLRSEK